MRKGEISRKLYFILFQLVLVIMVAVAMISFSSGIAENRGFLLTYIAKDVALTTTTILASPAKTSYFAQDLPGTRDVLIELSNHKAKAYKAESPDVAYEHPFLCAEDECPSRAAIPFNDFSIASKSKESSKPQFVFPSTCYSSSITYKGKGDHIIIKAALKDKEALDRLRSHPQVSIGFFNKDVTTIDIYASDKKSGCDMLKEVFST
jgi:hypothetical protein